jgi:hypothetical protein
MGLQVLDAVARQSIAEYKSLVIELASNSTATNPTAVSGVLVVVGKSVKDLETDVRQLQRRMRAAADLAEAERLGDQVQRARESADAAQAELERLALEYQRRIHEARDAAATTRGKATAATERQISLRATAGSILRETACPSIEAERRELVTARQFAELKLQKARAAVQQQTKRVRQKEELVAKVRGPHAMGRTFGIEVQDAEQSRNLDAMRSDLAEQEAALGALEIDTRESLATLDAELAELARRSADPVAGMKWSV